MKFILIFIISLSSVSISYAQRHKQEQPMSESLKQRIQNDLDKFQAGAPQKIENQPTYLMKDGRLVEIETYDEKILVNNRDEAQKRCGLSESPTTKIIGIKKINRDTEIILGMNNSRTVWKVVYEIGTGEMMFGEQQSSRKICLIAAETGEVAWR